MIRTIKTLGTEFGACSCMSRADVSIIKSLEIRVKKKIVWHDIVYEATETVVNMTHTFNFL